MENLPKILQQMAEQQEELKKRQQEHEKQHIAEKTYNAYLKIVGAHYDKSVAYTNLIIIAGYASFFAIWSQVRDHLPPIQELLAALSMLVSAVAFVTWEITKMIHSAIESRKLASLLQDETVRKDPQELQQRFEQYEAQIQRSTLPLIRWWVVQLCITIPFAVIAIGALLSGIVSGLITTFNEYSY